LFSQKGQTPPNYSIVPYIVKRFIQNVNKCTGFFLILFQKLASITVSLPLFNFPNQKSMHFFSNSVFLRKIHIFPYCVQFSTNIKKYTVFLLFISTIPA